MGTYLEPCQTSMIEFFFEYISQLTAANHFRKKKLIMDVWQGSKYASALKPVYT